MASNITLSGLVVAPGVQQTYAQWEVDDPNINGLPYLQLDRVELWASETNDRDSTDAIKVAEGITFANYVYSGFAKRYHWIRARDQEGQYGAWYPSSASAGVVGGAVWQNFETELTTLSGSIADYFVSQARYFKLGPNVTFFIDATIVDNGTGAGYIEFTLPIEANSQAPIHGFANVQTIWGQVTASSATARVYRYNGLYPDSGTSFSLNVTGTYEADE